MTSPSGSIAGILAGITLLLAGCLPPQANYSLGLGTSEVRGVVELPPPDPAAGPPLVVVYQYHSLMTGFAGEPGITRQTVSVPTVGQYGQFSIHMPQDVVAMDIVFTAPERLTDTFRFQRQLGVGTVTYTATLPVIPDWRSHFYTYLEPQLEHLIVDDRYRLSPRDQERLTQWLNDQKRRLERGKQRPAAQ
jgi:hypothetical protein